jgi:hypothetical protein
VAFLATAVALDVGLVGSPFRLRLRSFVRVILRTFVGTWFAFGGVELHLLQSVVVVVPGRDVPLDLGVSPALVNTFLFHLSFVDAFVDLERNLVHFLECRGATVAPGDLILDHILQSSIEVRGDGIVVPAGFDYQRLELSLVLRYRSALLDALEGAFRLHLLASVTKCGLQFTEECSRSSHNNPGCCLLVAGLWVLQIVL